MYQVGNKEKEIILRCTAKKYQDYYGCDSDSEGGDDADDIM